MTELTHLSLRTRMQAARLARLYRKYDRQRTDLNDETAVLGLLRQAMQDPRQDIAARYRELLAGLEAGEKSWLHAQGLDAGEGQSPVNAVSADEASPAKPVLVYRGQVVRR